MVDTGGGGGHGPGPRRRERHGCVDRRGPRPRRGGRPRLDPAGEGRPPHDPVGQGPQRHRRRHPRAARQAQPVRRAVGTDGRRHVRAHLHRHHRHRLRRAARRPAVHRRRRRLRARRAQPLDHDRRHGRRRDGPVGGPAAARQGRRVGTHRRSLAGAPGRVERRGLIRVTGGKLTTYRAMADDTVDVVQRALGGPAAGRAPRS